MNILGLILVSFIILTQGIQIDERASLLNGVTSFETLRSVAFSSCDIDILNQNSGGIPLIADKDGNYFAYAAESITGSGKMFYIGHNAYYYMENWATTENKVFLDNIFNWFGAMGTFQIGRFGSSFVAADLKSNLGSDTITIDDLSNADLDTVNLADYHVLTLNFAKTTLKKQKIVDYVNGGGNLFVAFNIWAWNDAIDINDSIEQYVFEECFRITLSKDSMSWWSYSGPNVLTFSVMSQTEVLTVLGDFGTEFIDAAPFVPSLAQEDKIQGLLQNLPMLTKSDITTAFDAIQTKFQASNYSMSLTNVVTNTKQTQIIYQVIEALSLIDTTALTHASDYPGTVTETTKQVNFIYTFPKERDGSFFTGLYAKAGDAITFEITENTENRNAYAEISIKSDFLADRMNKALPRFPNIGRRSFRIRNVAGDSFASAHGGLLFVSLSQQLSATGSFKIKINGAFLAPYYQKGVDTTQTWNAKKVLGIPWGVIESDKQGTIVATTPYFKSIADPKPVCDYMDKIFDDISEFSGDFRTAIQWWHADRVISVGYMHSGNPIQIPIEINDLLIGGAVDNNNATTLFTEPQWGFYHELGHNYQQDLWTWSWTIEVTVNIFSLRQTYINFGLMPLQAPWMGTAAEVVQFYKDHELNPVFDSMDARKILFSYAQIIENIGWEFMKHMFQVYRNLPNDQQPSTMDEQIQKWMELTSKQAGYNLIPRFRYWKWPYVNEVEPLVNMFNDWNNDQNVTDTWPGTIQVVVPTVYTQAAFYPNNNPSWTRQKTVDGVTTTETCCQVTTNDNFIIKSGWIVKINQDPSLAAGVVNLNFKNFTIYGNLTFDSSLNDITINTQSLNILDSGSLILGSQEQRYQGQFTILLDGVKTDPSLSEFVQGYPVGNKAIGVSGDFKLYGQQVQIPYTRLLANVLPNQNFIYVKEATGWQVGDELVIGPSGAIADQSEKKQILSIATDNQGTKITLNQTLQYFHFGDVNITINQKLDENVTQSLDLRAVVGLLSRQIKIQGIEQDNWGGHIKLYNQGLIILKGVELNNMGQIDTKNGGIQFQEVFRALYNKEDVSIIQESAIHDCFGICFRAKNSIGFNLTNNIIYRAHPILIDLYQTKNFSIESNALLSALERPSYDPLNEPYDAKAFIFMNFTNYTNYTTTFRRDIKKDGIIIRKNVGQGSDGLGYAFPSYNCFEKQGIINGTNGIFDNQVMGTKIGVLFFPFIDASECVWAGRVNIAWSKKGFQFAANSTQNLQVEYVISAENNLGVSLRHYSHQYKEALFTTFKNSAIYGVSRTNCSDCFTNDLKNIEFCSDNRGLQTLASTIWTGNYSLLVDPIIQVDKISNYSTISAKADVIGVKFYNFQQSYDSLKLCGNTHAIATNPESSDFVPPHNLMSTSCNNCDQTSKLWYDSPKKQWLGEGGCGEIQCSGLNNIIISDLEGGFLSESISETPTKLQAISPNELFTDAAQTCQLIPEWNNGYYCNQEVAVNFIFQNVEETYGKLDAPIQLIDMATNQTFNQINSFREWEYQEGVPQARRQNQFGPVIFFSNLFQVKFNIRPPRKMIQSMKGTADANWINPSITYLEPLSLKIVNRGAARQPNPNIYTEEGDQSQYDLTQTPVCGAHNYFLKNNTLSYILTGGDKCNLQILQVSSLFLTAGLPANIEQFLSDNKPVNFILRVCAFLNISSSQLRIVGFNTPKPSSTRFRRLQPRQLASYSEMNVLLDEPDGLDGENPNVEPMTDEQQKAYLASKGQSLREGVANKLLDVGFELLSLKMQIRMVPTDAAATYDPSNQDSSLKFEDFGSAPNLNDEEEETDNSGVIAAAVIVPLLVIAIILVVIYFIIRQKRQSEGKIFSEQIMDAKDIGSPQALNQQEFNIPNQFSNQQSDAILPKQQPQEINVQTENEQKQISQNENAPQNSKVNAESAY